MRILRYFTMALFCAFTALAVSFANSNSEQIFSSQHGPYGMMLGNCKLSVKTFGSNVVFTPIGHSAKRFEVSESVVSRGAPVEIAVPFDGTEGKVLQTLTVSFGDVGGQIVPAKYTFKSEYARPQRSIERYWVDCLDLKSDTN